MNKIYTVKNGLIFSVVIFKKETEKAIKLQDRNIFDKIIQNVFSEADFHFFHFYYNSLVSFFDLV